MSKSEIKFQYTDDEIRLMRLDTFQAQVQKVGAEVMRNVYQSVDDIVLPILGDDINDTEKVRRRVLFVRAMHTNLETIFVDGKPVAEILWNPPYGFATVRALEPPKPEPDRQFAPSFDEGFDAGFGAVPDTRFELQGKRVPPCVAHDGASTEALDAEGGEGAQEPPKAGPWPIN